MIPFVKTQALGNDFILVPENPGIPVPAMVAVCWPGNQFTQSRKNAAQRIALRLYRVQSQ